MLHHSLCDFRGGIFFIQLPEFVAIFKHPFDAVQYRVLQPCGVPFFVDWPPIDGARVLGFLVERVRV